MNIELLSYTQNALDLLLYTKNTRLQGELTLEEIGLMPQKWKDEQLDYMKKTIQSSFEFVTYAFKISGVTRSFTHQLVRSRHNSYAQESMRAVDARDHDYRNETGMATFDDAMKEVFDQYAYMIDKGVAIQDAREILPTGIHTSIIIGTNLRSLSDMASLRLCTRTAGEYQEAFKAIKAEVEKVHPWAEPFLQVACVKTGICQFPNYTECPIQEYTLDPEIKAAIMEDVKVMWERTNHVADPSIRRK